MRHSLLPRALTSEGVFYQLAVMGKLNTAVIPIFIGGLIGLKVKKLRVAIGDFTQCARLFSNIDFNLFFYLAIVSLLNTLSRLVEFINVQLKPVHAMVKA